MEKNNLEKFILIGILVVSSVVNFPFYVKGFAATPLQAFSSILCVFIWVFYGYYNGRRKNKSYIWFCTIFWGIGLAILFISLCAEDLTLGLLGIFFISGPLYGLNYFINIESVNIQIIIHVCIIYFMTLIAFFIANQMHKKET